MNSWETDIANIRKLDLLFSDIRIENEKIKGTLKVKERSAGSLPAEKYFSIYKRGDSFIIKSDFFVTHPEELEIKFDKNNLLVFDKKSKVEIKISNKESYD